jgi:hypothetical protein
MRALRLAFTLTLALPRQGGGDRGEYRKCTH